MNGAAHIKLIIAFLLAYSILGTCGAAQAGQAEVRDVAIANNCPPKKIEVYQQALGQSGVTLYRVQCTMPKAVGAAADNAAKPPDALLISCVQNLCDMQRPIAADQK